MKIKLATAVCAASLLLQAGGAAAQLPPRPADSIVGSDTFDGVMRNLFEVQNVTAPAGGGVAGGIGTTAAQYLGLGSSSGERQLEGAAEADEPECGPIPADPAHPGCQEVAPMSRQMDGSICNDAEAVGQAEGIAVCDDGLAVFTDNQSMKGDDAAACAAFQANNYEQSENANGNDFVGTVGQLGVAGALPATGYVIGDGMPAWQDVLRVIYTGCQNDEGDCAEAVDRLVRCGDPVREELIENWNVIQGGVDCNAGGTCATGLRRAYRRDDNSGTTGVFLGFLGVDGSLASRPKVVSTLFDCANADDNRCCDLPGDVIRIWGIPGNHAFCDGGHHENFLPDCQNGEFIQAGGDPIRRACAPEDELCDLTGQGGVVQAVVSTPAEADAFATHQCTGTAYGFQSWFSGSPRGAAWTAGVHDNPTLCPDGNSGFGDLCLWPRFQAGGVVVTRNCMGTSRTNSPLVPDQTDGRCYNVARRNIGTEIDWIADGVYPEVPSWRMNSYVAETSSFPPQRYTPGFEITAAEEVCTEGSATRQIGCVVSNTTCTIGFAGREAVFAPAAIADSRENEPFKIQNEADPANFIPPRDENIGPVAADEFYALQRPLFVNAIGGFGNITADCMARGEDAAWCSDQRSIADAFYNISAGSAASQACDAAGFIPRTAATRSCVGATDAAGCGAPTVQPYNACLPN